MFNKKVMFLLGGVLLSFFPFNREEKICLPFPLGGGEEEELQASGHSLWVVII